MSTKPLLLFALLCCLLLVAGVADSKSLFSGRGFQTMTERSRVFIHHHDEITQNEKRLSIGNNREIIKFLKWKSKILKHDDSSGQEALKPLEQQ